MPRSLNQAELIGNLTRDPELRYTPSGTAVCTFGVATNRSWTTDTGEKKEETEFHRIVCWSKLAELCSQFLVKGRKVYVQGRLATRSFMGQDGQQRTITEIVIDDMILLDSKFQSANTSATKTPQAPTSAKQTSKPKEETEKPSGEEEVITPAKQTSDEEVKPDDIAF